MKKKVVTNTYQIEIPTTFAQEQQSHEHFSVWNIDEAHQAQFPIINMALSEVKDLMEEYVGDSYEACLYSYFDEKRSFITEKEDEIIEVAGKKAYLRRSSSAPVVQNETIDCRHLFINIPLDELHMLEFSADCEASHWEKYAPIFMDAIHSLKLFGDYAKHLAVQNKALDEMVARLDKLRESAEKLSSKYDGFDDAEASEQLPKPAPFIPPVDGKEVFEIGGFQFEFTEEDCQWLIPEFSKELSVKIAGKAKAPQKGIQAKLIDDYPGRGEVSLSFSAKGLYHHGQPKGVFDMEEDKCQSPYLYNRTEGFEYSLKFYGTITFQHGWVAYDGYLKASYNNQPVFPVKIYKKYDSNELAWENYRFQSMEEALQAPPAQVHHLTLAKPNFEQLPDEFLQFTNLQTFSVVNHQRDLLPLKALPEGIGNLSKLRELTINGASLKQLPQSIGQLKALEHLFINRCMLESIPESIWQMPVAKYVHFSDNQLTELPESINMPALQSLDLTKNGFKTLPQSLALQPKLKNLKLEGNTLSSLPDAFNQISNIGLASEDKRRLLDFEYKGADGKGIVSWDDAVFMAENDPTLIAPATQVIEAQGIQKYKTALLALLKRAVGFNLTDTEDYQQVGNHRFGGMPDLPKGMAYPKFEGGEGKPYAYEFIAQINCADIASLQQYLPRTGMLYFFLTTMHDIYHDAEESPVKVIHYEGKVEDLVSGSTLSLEESDYYEMYDNAYEASKASPVVFCSAPAFYSIHQNDYLFKGAAAMLKEEEDFLYDEAYDCFEEPLKATTPTTHTINGYGFSQHEYPEHSISLHHRGNPEDWVILLTVTSSGSFQWGDAGDLFFVIHKSDLMQGNFSNVQCTMYSS